MRVLRTSYVNNWEARRADEIKTLTSTGKVPHYAEMDKMKKEGKEPSPEEMIESAPLISGLFRAFV